MAVSMTALLMVIIGMMKMCVGVYCYHYTSEAAREGARWAIVRGSSSGQETTADAISTYVKTLGYPALTPANMTVTVSWAGFPTGVTCTPNNNPCDNPGNMVGPEAEKTATVRHFSRMFVTGANLSVPVVTVILRKAYGLGAQAMAAGTFGAPAATVAWPTGELGPMGLEGAVRLGFRRELDAAGDGRAALEDQLIAGAYERGKALNVASVFEIDDVIDPADTRAVVLAALRGHPTGAPGGKRRPFIDAW